MYQGELHRWELNDQVQILKASPCSSHHEAMDGLYSSKSLFVYARNAVDVRAYPHYIVHE